MIDKTWLAWVVRGLLVCGVGAAAAAEPHESYAVVSLVGDAITIVNYQGVTGSSLDRNVQTRVPLDDGHFDGVAERVAANELRRLDPDARVESVKLVERASYGDNTALHEDGAMTALLQATRPLLKASDTHYLIVVSKSRGEARLRMQNGMIGSGKLTGLGFYIDTYKRTRKVSTGESGRGFIAPYAYLQVDLVDLRTGAVTRSEKAVETATRANVGSESDLDPWNAISAEEKVRLLDALVVRAVRTGVAHVVAPG